MALDVGESRVGVAVGETEVRLATPRSALERRGRVADDVWVVLSVAADEGVGELVVGIPLSLSGKEGQQARSVLTFVDELRAQTEMRVNTVDERYSTVEAERRMRAAGAKPSRNRGRVDSAAAAIILQTFFDRLPESGAV
jgi:putative Holliday junction resolvase